MNGYPDNVCVHGNGFVQISLGGNPHETRIHVWHKDLPDCQHVNTATHDHRFGFNSTVLRGVVEQEELAVVRGPFAGKAGRWTKWTAGKERLATGNRPLVKQDGLHHVEIAKHFARGAGHSYSMPERMFHRTTPLTDIAVTLMTKTAVLPTDRFQASVLCHSDREPDQEFDRFQIPFDELEPILIDALVGTPFEGLRPWAS